MPVESFASELDLGAPAGGHIAFDPSSDGPALRCSCPLCSGQAVVVDPPEAAGLQVGGDLDLQAYLNADERSGASPNGKPNFTVERAALQLTGFTETTNPDGSIALRAAPGWGGVAGRAFTVTYAFRADAPATMPDDAGGFERFNTAQITQAELALRAWSDVANITFVRVGVGNSGENAYSNNAAILFGNYTTGVDGASAFGFYPGSTSASRSDGDVWVNSTISYNLNPTTGAYGGQVLLHEIGHAIGLAHPGDYNADGDTTFTYAQDAEYYEDSRQYTVMSYFSESNTGANFRGSYAAAPLLDDIAGAQVEYGANMTTRTGDTVYGFNSTADRPWFAAVSSGSRMVFAVWDAGGNDTFDFSGFFDNQVIDLRQGHFSDVGSLRGNVAVAMNTVIENAIGGSGSDRIVGNSAANTLMGGAGNDSITGGDGIGFLRGEDGNDTLIGGAQFDDMHGNAGNDTLHGGGDGDWVVGGKDNDLLYGDEGGDVVLGNLGLDTLEGGDGDDVVRGGQGDDVVRGGAGNDWISGDRGTDTLTGGAGADIFHTFDGAGVDRVTDFNAAEGDRVFLLAGAQYTVAQSGADTVISVTGVDGGQLVLAGVQMTTLGSGWIFGA